MVYPKYIKEKEVYIMKKLIVILTVLWLGLSAFANSVKADDYNTAVIGHVISETIKNSDIDHKSICLLYTSPSPRDRQKSRMPSSA